MALWSVPGFHLVPLPRRRVTTCQVTGNVSYPCRGDGVGMEKAGKHLLNADWVPGPVLDAFPVLAHLNPTTALQNGTATALISSMRKLTFKMCPG